jgi:acyl carrier protein
MGDDSSTTAPCYTTQAVSADILLALRSLLVVTLRLQIDPATIDPDADLFRGPLGLDSLDAVQILTAVEHHFGIRVDDRDLATYSLSTLSGIAQLVRDRTGR